MEYLGPILFWRYERAYYKWKSNDEIVSFKATTCLHCSVRLSAVIEVSNSILIGQLSYGRGRCGPHGHRSSLHAREHAGDEIGRCDCTCNGFGNGGPGPIGRACRPRRSGFSAAGDVPVLEQGMEKEVTLCAETILQNRARSDRAYSLVSFFARSEHRSRAASPIAPCGTSSSHRGSAAGLSRPTAPRGCSRAGCRRSGAGRPLEGAEGGFEESYLF